jgi:uncharacterized membrane protein YccC
MIISSPFYVLITIAVICILLSMAIVMTLNKAYDFSLKVDLVVGTFVAILLFFFAVRVVF